MKKVTPWVAATLAGTTGALHWGLCSMIVGGEAWDGAIYFLSLPAVGVACATIGALHPWRAWRFGAIAAGAQAVGLFVGAGKIGSLFPITIALFALLGACLSACSGLGAYLVRQLGSPSPASVREPDSQTKPVELTPRDHP